MNVNRKLETKEIFELIKMYDVELESCFSRIDECVDKKNLLVNYIFNQVKPKRFQKDLIKEADSNLARVDYLIDQRSMFKTSTVGTIEQGLEELETQIKGNDYFYKPKKTEVWMQ